MKRHCPKCTKEFKNSSKLRQHLVNDHHVGMVKCKVCGIWIKETRMRLHVKRKHGFPTYRSYLINSGVINPRMTESERKEWLEKGKNRKTLARTRFVQGGLPSLGKRK
jgi:hypothetical protein